MLIAVVSDAMVVCTVITLEIVGVTTAVAAVCIVEADVEVAVLVTCCVVDEVGKDRQRHALESAALANEARALAFEVVVVVAARLALALGGDVQSTSVTVFVDIAVSVEVETDVVIVVAVVVVLCTLSVRRPSNNAVVTYVTWVVGTVVVVRRTA